ncbi:DUF6519 domain-containing protein [Variovorax sp. JS1663]|uniref:DUF6519 domain-containing protein n=1 Tax=Variovorax sp. JS1663 TaxID=1851577 RepID=UPI000B34832B|nr:DUF6519 domain-containing protein [Variovorax sp. JS1663]OUL98508.1 hypothetical protein A8M77_31080 [Variovorax sp. JS1663]
MRGDFSRDSFDKLRHYSRVLQQQGRLELDAGGNERQAIQLHLLRSLAADLIGPQGGPGTGFELRNPDALAKNFVIGKGHYYVDGWLCENDADVLYAKGDDGAPPPQTWLPEPDALETNKRYLAYLDVFERHLTATEVDDAADPGSPAALREVALGGPDTTTRAQVVWQVRISLGTGAPALPPGAPEYETWNAWMQANWAQWQALWQPPWRGQMAAKAAEVSEDDAGNPCVVSPRSRYRGLENQLYRVEIHRSGSVTNDEPTFVWSRENASVLFAVERIDDKSVQLAAGWRDARFDLAVGDIVELSDDWTALGGRAGPLRRVSGVDIDTGAVYFEADGPAGSVSSSRHAVLRRWDHGRRRRATESTKALNDGRAQVADDLALTLEEGKWLTIEEGLSIRFDAAPAGQQQHYRSGDYWLVPARAAIGDVLWPRGAAPQREPLPQPPHGVEHHYAPLAILEVGADNKVGVFAGPTLRFKSLVELTN